MSNYNLSEKVKIQQTAHLRKGYWSMEEQKEYFQKLFNF